MVLLFFIFYDDAQSFCLELPRDANPKFCRVVKDYLVDYEFEIASFLETRVSGPKADDIILKLGFDFSHRIEA